MERELETVKTKRVIERKEMKTVITKQTKTLGLLEFKSVDRETAKKMIIENHYSHKFGSTQGQINVGVFKDGELLGVASYGYLMNPASTAKLIKGGTKDNFIELNRLWISDELGKNAETLLISNSFKIIKQDYPHIIAVQSFADGRLGCGTIYKAANFDYYGYHTSVFLEDKETGDVFHKTMSEDGRSKSMIGFNLNIVRDKYNYFKVKTYRYVFILNKKFRDKMLIEKKEYPSYEKGMEYITDFITKEKAAARTIKNIDKWLAEPETKKYPHSQLLEWRKEFEKWV